MTIKYLDSNRISVISSSCLVHFTLDEASGNPTNHATTANGFPLGTGSTNNGTNGSSGATQNVTGKFDKCFEFGGGDNKQVNIGTVLSGTGDFSISLWINHSNNNSNYASVVSNYGGGNTSGYQFYMNGTGNTISFHTSGSAINGGTAMSASAWHHVVVTRTSGVLNLYVDGSSDATAVANTHSISTSLSDAIGGKSDGSSGFNGKIDEVSIWLRGISASEVSKLYNGGTGDTLLEAKGLGVWTNPLENVGQIAQLSGSDAANSYTAASEFYTISTDTWGSVFNIASGGRGRGGSAGTPTHCYLLGGQDGSKYYNEVDRIAWADKTQNATTMSGTRAWGNTVSNAVSVCVGQSFYYGSYSNSIDEFTYPTMTSTSQGNTSANFAFSGAFGNSSFGFVAKNATINKYTYSDKSNTNSSLATPPSPPNHAGHTGNSTVGMSINNTSASTNAKYDTYNIAANTWASNTVTSTTPYENGRASGSTKYNLYSTQTNTSVARSCEKFNYGSGTLTSFTSVTTNLDGGDGDAAASSNNIGVTS